MAVPYYKRSVSRKEYEYHFRKSVMKPAIDLLNRNFAIKDEDVAPLVWLIQIKRREIMKSLSVIATYISRAKFYPEDEEQQKVKMTYQDRAKQETFALYDNLQLCSEIFPVKKKNSYTLLGKAIKEEVQYLKYWRKYTKKDECTSKSNNNEEEEV